MIGRFKLLKLALLVLLMGSMAFVGWTYASVRLTDNYWLLFRGALLPDTGWLTRKFAKNEIERRIAAGQEDGVALLIDILVIGRANEVTRGLAEEEAVSLIKNHVDINSHDKRGYTPAHIAVATNDANLLRWLLDNGADPTVLTDRGEDDKDEVDVFEYLEFVREQDLHEDMTAVSGILLDGSPAN